MSLPFKRLWSPSRASSLRTFWKAKRVYHTFLLTVMVPPRGGNHFHIITSILESQVLYFVRPTISFSYIYLDLGCVWSY